VTCHATTPSECIEFCVELREFGDFNIACVSAAAFKSGPFWPPSWESAKDQEQ
jgi:hypothetical protein